MVFHDNGIRCIKATIISIMKFKQCEQKSKMEALDKRVVVTCLRRFYAYHSGNGLIWDLNKFLVCFKKQRKFEKLYGIETLKWNHKICFDTFINVYHQVLRLKFA